MRIELIVFGSILALIASLSLVFTIPQMQTYTNSSSGSKSSLPVIGKAPDFVRINNWINAGPLKIGDLKGKVVLVDFWTYSCINCIRTLPYLKDWDQKYSGKGLVIIGVHTPEFEFEKDAKNVKAAVERYGLKYAVAQDNNKETWKSYKNRYWPMKYIIDAEGNIRYDHIGEGGYEETETVIQDLLKEANQNVTEGMTKLASDLDTTQLGSPEIYLGYKFARNPLGNPEGFSSDGVVDYKQINLSGIKLGNVVYLSGEWEDREDRIIAVKDSKLFLAYKAKKVNIVAGGKSKISVLLDGTQLKENYLGDDTRQLQGQVTIDQQRLYNIISSEGYETHILGIDADPGFELYTFTFG